MTTIPKLEDLSVKVFADGADLGKILELCAYPWIRGFTTNPTLMRKAGIRDYEGFARELLAAAPDRPISLEAFADELEEIERQARLIASWGPNVYVKVPITNTRRESTLPLARRLSRDGVRVNLTAILTAEQIAQSIAALAGGAPSYVSVFAGRIADTGRDPLPLLAEAVRAMRPEPQMELIWASPRELLNILQADWIGCHVITLTADLLHKLPLIGRDLVDYSLDTVRMFHADGAACGYRI